MVTLIKKVGITAFIYHQDFKERFEKVYYSDGTISIEAVAYFFK